MVRADGHGGRGSGGASPRTCGAHLAPPARFWVGGGVRVHGSEARGAIHTIALAAHGRTCGIQPVGAVPLVANDEGFWVRARARAGSLSSGTSLVSARLRGNSEQPIDLRLEAPLQGRHLFQDSPNAEELTDDGMAGHGLAARLEHEVEGEVGAVAEHELSLGLHVRKPAVGCERPRIRGGDEWQDVRLHLLELVLELREQLL